MAGVQAPRRTGGRVTHLLVIGALKLDEDGADEVAFKVEIGSARKVDVKAGDGDDDGVTTRKGREVRDIKIELSWPDRASANKRGAEIVKVLDASRADPGDPPSFGYERNGLDLSELKSVRAIEIKKTEGPNVNDKGVNVYKIESVSWVKPAPKQDKAAKTPTDPKGFTMDTSRVHGGTDKLSAKGPKTPSPKVKP